MLLSVCGCSFFRALLWLLMSFFMQIFFRLSDWSICTTWYKMLLSDWLLTYFDALYYSGQFFLNWCCLIENRFLYI